MEYLILFIEITFTNLFYKRPTKYYQKICFLRKIILLYLNSNLNLNLNDTI